MGDLASELRSCCACDQMLEDEPCLYCAAADEIERLTRVESVVIELVRSAQDWGNQVAVSEEVFTHLEAALEVNGRRP
jgi:hypothetical protein